MAASISSAVVLTPIENLGGPAGGGSENLPYVRLGKLTARAREWL